MGASESPLIPDWLQGATTPGAGFRKLLEFLANEHSSDTRDEKIEVFREGIEAIRRHVGELTITQELEMSFPGRAEYDVIVFLGLGTAKGTPLIAFDGLGRVWTGSFERSTGRMNDGRQVFDAFRANRLC